MCLIESSRTATNGRCGEIVLSTTFDIFVICLFFTASVPREVDGFEPTHSSITLINGLSFSAVCSHFNDNLVALLQFISVGENMCYTSKHHF